MTDQSTEPVRTAAADAVGGDQPTAPVAQVRPKRKGPGPLDIVLGAALLVAVTGVSFYVGRSTAPAANAGANGRGPFGRGGGAFPSLAPGQTFDPNNLPGGGGFPGGGNSQGRFPGGGAGISGTVTAVDGDSITIKLASGATIDLALDGDTEFHQQADAEAADVTIGSTVQVQVERLGQAGAGGTGTATDVTLVP